jgi:ABC-2 type transport system ATP-binding protein
VAGDLVELIVTDAAQLPRAATALSALVPGSTADIDGAMVSLRVPHAGRELAGLLRTLDREGIALDSIEVRRPTLDDVFLTLTGRSLREDAA